MARLATGMLLTGCLGCQGTEMSATRESAAAKPSESASTEDMPVPKSEQTSPGAGDGQEQVASGNKVSIDNFTFKPETLEVAAGTKVTWVNGDDVPHTVRSNEDAFRSGTLDTDDVYERVFLEPGTYEYYCGVHRHMTGKIVVKAIVAK